MKEKAGIYKNNSKDSEISSNSNENDEFEEILEVDYFADETINSLDLSKFFDFRRLIVEYLCGDLNSNLRISYNQYLENLELDIRQFDENLKLVPNSELDKEIQTKLTELSSKLIDDFSKIMEILNHFEKNSDDISNLSIEEKFHFYSFSKIKQQLLTEDAKKFSHEQFNEILLMFGQPIVKEGFFNYFFDNKTKIKSEEEMKFFLNA